MGGGNRHAETARPRHTGLSPRGRGKPHAHGDAELEPGSIPAWAGETSCHITTPLGDRVYPRVGGGNPPISLFIRPYAGLSPRGRGKLCAKIARLLEYGSIPAWAGETECACGRFGCNALRSIPAWAGETRSDAETLLSEKVYPRVGGGNFQKLTSLPSMSGLSPRGRGKQALIVHIHDRLRSIPAWAGETSTAPAALTSCTVYPRVGGGNADSTASASAGSGLSPRGRGKPEACRTDCRCERSIPAWAGETNSGGCQQKGEMVYPRVGGGNDDVSSIGVVSVGLSPRGRGKRRYTDERSLTGRSIPAWAGETRRRD